jgi:predicted esterase
VLTRHLTVARTARYHLLGDPDGPWSEVWYVLHGYGHLAQEFLELCRPLANPERLVVAPEGLSRYYRRGTAGSIGASWMTREDRETEVSDYVAYLDALHQEIGGGRSGASCVANVLGFSQGTATAARWTVLGDMRPSRLVLCCGGFPPDLDGDRARTSLSETKVELVLGQRDTAVSSEREAERLSAVLPDAVVRTFDGGHELDAAVLTAL